MKPQTNLHVGFLALQSKHILLCGLLLSVAKIFLVSSADRLAMGERKILSKSRFASVNVGWIKPTEVDNMRQRSPGSPLMKNSGSPLHGAHASFLVPKIDCFSDIFFSCFRPPGQTARSSLGCLVCLRLRLRLRRLSL